MNLSKDEFDSLLKRNKALAKMNGFVRDEDVLLPSQRYTVQDSGMVVMGNPVPKPRMTRRDKWAKRPCVLRYRAYADKLKTEAYRLNIPLHKVRQINVTFYLERKNKAHLSGSPHLLRPDTDNLTKAVKDALFEQDCVIWKETATKLWDDGQGARTSISFET